MSPTWASNFSTNSGNKMWTFTGQPLSHIWRELYNKFWDSFKIQYDMVTWAGFLIKALIHPLAVTERPSWQVPWNLETLKTKWIESPSAYGTWNSIRNRFITEYLPFEQIWNIYGLSGCNRRSISAPLVISSAFVTDWDLHFKIGFLASIFNKSSKLKF